MGWLHQDWLLSEPAWAKLSATQRWISTVIARHANSRDGRAYPGPERIAAITGLSLRAVRANLPAIEASQIMRVIKSPGRRTEYWFPVLKQHSTKSRSGGPNESATSNEEGWDADQRSTSAETAHPPVHDVPETSAETAHPPVHDVPKPLHEVHTNLRRNSTKKLRERNGQPSATAAGLSGQSPRAHFSDDEGKGTKLRPHPLPADWQPSPEAKAYAKEWGQSVSELIELFTIHYRGNGTMKVDWDQVFREWAMKDGMRQGIDRNKQNGNNSLPDPEFDDPVPPAWPSFP